MGLLAISACDVPLTIVPAHNEACGAVLSTSADPPVVAGIQRYFSHHRGSGLGILAPQRRRAATHLNYIRRDDRGLLSAGFFSESVGRTSLDIDRKWRTDCPTDLKRRNAIMATCHALKLKTLNN